METLKAYGVKPTVAMDDGGRFVIAWEQKDLDYPDGKEGAMEGAMDIRPSCSHIRVGTFIVTNFQTGPESGISSVIIAGFVVGNARTPVHRELKEFKEQLTVMLIGMLFVMLAADVRVAEVTGLGWRGVLVVVALMFIVRPVNVLMCTMRAGLTWKDKAFVSWLAPRGIVAAAVASLFHDRLTGVGFSGGE